MMNQLYEGMQDLDIFCPVKSNLFYHSHINLDTKIIKNSCFKLFLYLSRKIEFGFVALCEENLVESLSSP